MKKYKHVLIDGRNILYRAIFAELGHRTQPGTEMKEPIKGIVLRVYLKFLLEYLDRFQPEQIHVFWDDSGKNIWRNDIYPEYKANRIGAQPGLGFLMANQFKMALMLLEPLGVRQYLADRQEADDLIYAFCYNTKSKTAIISNDSDMKQIPQRLSHVDLFKPMAKDAQDGPVKPPDHDVAVQKALMGDSSDNIRGYAGVGEKRSAKLAADPKALLKFLDSPKAQVMVEGKREPAGPDIFRRNMNLIDLSLAPSLDENVEYIKWIMSREMVYNHDAVLHAIRKYELEALKEAHLYCLPFAELTADSRAASRPASGTG